jgi:hypothetical protein
MKKLTFLILVFITNFVFAVDEKKASKIQIGIVLTPNLSYRSLFSNNINFTSIIEGRNGYEIPKLGYNIGCNLIYNINTKISLESGLQFANKAYKQKLATYQIGSQYDPLTGQYNSLSTINYKQTYNYYSLDIPLRVNYEIGEKKLKKIFTAGASVNILLYNSTVTKQFSPEKKTSRSSSDIINPINFSPEIGFGLDYELSKKTNIRIIPNFSYGIIKIVDAPIAEHLWQFGCQLSYFKKL